MKIICLKLQKKKKKKTTTKKNKITKRKKERKKKNLLVRGRWRGGTAGRLPAPFGFGEDNFDLEARGGIFGDVLFCCPLAPPLAPPLACPVDPGGFLFGEGGGGLFGGPKSLIIILFFSFLFVCCCFVGVFV